MSLLPPPDKTPHNLIGEAGEAFVRFDLLRRGVVCHPTSTGAASYDLVAEAGDRLLRIEVKTCAQQTLADRGDGRKKPRYAFGLSKNRRQGGYNQVDVFAFVALDKPSVHYVPWMDLNPNSATKNIGPTLFDNPDESFNKVFGNT